MTVHQVYQAGRPYQKKVPYTDEWYTPRIYVDAAREVMGDIDLAPASCAEAAKHTGILNYYSKENSGLENDWYGRIWCNPPYTHSLMLQFAKKYVEQLPNIEEAIILVSAKSDTRWFRLYLENTDAVCFHKGRIKFTYGPDPSQSSDPNPLGTAFFYYGPNTAKFISIFSKFGPCCTEKRTWGGARAGAGRKKGQGIDPNSERQTKPWEAMGISAATYYRRLRGQI